MSNFHAVSLTLGTGIAVFLSACAPLTGAAADPATSAPHVSAETDPTTMTPSQPIPDTVDVPADAAPATGAALTDIMNSQWVPQPASGDITVSFVPQGGIEGFRLEGGPCNGYGLAIHPDVETGSYTTTPLPVTRMACETMAYEGAVTRAFDNGTAFLTTDPDTLYVAGNDGALKLVRAR